MFSNLNNYRVYGVLLLCLSFALMNGLSGNILKVSDAYAAEAAKIDKAGKAGPGVKADSSKAGKSSVMSEGSKEPTVITSNSLTADNKARTALFTGSVVAKKGDGTLFADRMLVFYVDAGDGENSNIDRIECTGHVKLVRNNRVITAGKAVYYAGAEERAVFTDSPRATENRNVVTGTVMTYYFKDDRSVVEKSKIFIVEKESGPMDRKPSDGKPADKSRKKK